jgi:hypothetical protein
MRNPLLHAVTASLLLVGCTGTLSGEVTTPSMVYIDSDVRVIADYDEPIFYTNSFYWRQTNGVWYRSSSHSGGWAVYASPPAAILRIERPTAYVRYRGSANVQTRERPPTYVRGSANVETRKDNDRPNQPAKHKQDKNDNKDKDDKKDKNDKKDHHPN